jgi:dipeptidyl aminopeptidase/acylaminoacyl peptidase
MTTDRDFDRITMAWLADGPEELSDRVLDAVVDEIHVTPQRHALRLPWRFSTMTTPARVATAAVIGVLAVGGALFAFNRSQPAVGGPGPSPTPVVTAAPSVAPSASPVARTDYSDVPGRLLVQHLGNALDGSEATATGGNFGTRRFYLMDPDGSNITELLPGQPATGKNMADISPDGTKVVFMDWSDTPKIHEVNLDGTGFRTITTACDCLEADPAYSPEGTQIAFVRGVGPVLQIGIRDLATDKVTMLAETEGLDSGAAGGEFPEQPSWSPDGASIVYQMSKVGADGRVESSRIRIIDIASRAIRDLPISTELKAGEPKFSPDGSLILFVSGPAEQTLGQQWPGGIYTIKPDGTAMTELTLDGGTGASWTPDGKHILFYHMNHIWLMDPDGANQALWSADGPDFATTETGYGYTSYWIPPAP